MQQPRNWGRSLFAHGPKFSNSISTLRIFQLKKHQEMAHQSYLDSSIARTSFISFQWGFLKGFWARPNVYFKYLEELECVKSSDLTPLCKKNDSVKLLPLLRNSCQFSQQHSWSVFLYQQVEPTKYLSSNMFSRFGKTLISIDCPTEIL